MSFEIVRADKLWQQAGAYSVRIQGMARQHNIPLDKEFDSHDGPETKYIVILDGIYPIATCRIYEETPDTVMIGRVVVLPEYRGNGLGRRTVEEAEKWAKELGYLRIHLESRIEKIPFYEKLGYQKENRPVIHGDTFDCILMQKTFVKD